MDMTILGIIVLGVGGCIYTIYSIMNVGKKPSVNQNNINKNVMNDVKNINKKNNKVITDVKDTEHQIPRKDMFKFMEFDKISDNMIVQDKESKYTMVLQCKGINYDLMSEVEQIAVEEGFINFLNTLKYPIQIYVQARAVNLKGSLEMYNGKVNEIVSQYNEANEKFQKVAKDIHASDHDVTQAGIMKERFANMTEYAQDIVRYVEKLSLNKHMLQRKFYIVLSYFKSEINTVSEFTHQEMHELCQRELYTRAQTLISSLQSCSVGARVLTSNELAELLYISYNRDDEKLLDIQTALESGFYRMYSTSKDIQDKKDEVLRKQIQEEAMHRVREAIDIALDNGTLKTREQLEEEFENEADIEALRILDQTDIEDEAKKKVMNVIVDNHNKEAAKRDKIRKSKKEKEDVKLEVNNEHNHEVMTFDDGSKIDETQISEELKKQVDEPIITGQNNDITKDNKSNDADSINSLD
jgi:hypothetical protein